MIPNTPSTNSTPPFYRDLRVLRVLVQIAFLIVIVLIIGWLVNNTQRGLQRSGLAYNFDFLNQPSSFQIDEGLTPRPHLREDTFAHAFALGFINTLRVLVVGLVLTTILGLIMGVARLSTNWLIRNIAVVYIEVMQNTPLLLQLVFLYVGVFLTMPPIRQAVELPGPSYLSIRGLAIPRPVITDTTLLWLVITIIGAVVGWLVWRQSRRVMLETGRKTYPFERGAAIVLLASLGSWLILLAVTGYSPLTVSFPERVGPRYIETAGIIVSPEFVAIVTGLVLYTGAFVAEIVRAGIQSVPRGQWEAARSQGFGYFQILRLIVLPQALRVMIPPLTNQYLNLIKNSSLGAIVGYSDLFGISKTIQLQSGQALQVITVVMVLYLVLDLAAAFIMNMINARVQLRTR